MTLTLLLMLAALPHKFHAGFAEMEYNPETGKLETVLRLFSDDLEAALTRRLHHKVVLDTEPDLDAAVLAYVTDVLSYKDAAGTAHAPTWVGMESDVKHSFIYLEFPAAGPPKGASVSYSVFFELFADQHNTVNLKHGDAKDSLAFVVGDGFKAFNPR